MFISFITSRPDFGNGSHLADQENEYCEWKSKGQQTLCQRRMCQEELSLMKKKESGERSVCCVNYWQTCDGKGFCVILLLTLLLILYPKPGWGRDYTSSLMTTKIEIAYEMAMKRILFISFFSAWLNPFEWLFFDCLCSKFLCFLSLSVFLSVCIPCSLHPLLCLMPNGSYIGRRSMTWWFKWRKRRQFSLTQE